MPFDINTLRQANAKRWAVAKLTRASEYIGSDKHPGPAVRILAAKNRYQKIEAMCRALGYNGPHWVFIAASHLRESNLDFTTHLGQGDPLSRKTVHVPAGRGPFFGADAFERGAVDALVDCDPKAAKIKDWSMPFMLTTNEMFNGLKYAYAHRPSPYIWSGTDQYTIGKVTHDHGPIEEVVDKQLGVAGLIMTLVKLDPSITFPSVGLQKAPEPIKPLEATTPAFTPPKAPVAPPKPDTGPILNKEGEDISDHLYSLGHDVWEWLKHH